MSTPHRRQAAWTPRVSIHLFHGLPRLKSAVLFRACRSVAQALEHKGKDDSTGTEGLGKPQERAMPTPHRRQATWAPKCTQA